MSIAFYCLTRAQLSSEDQLVIAFIHVVAPKGAVCFVKEGAVFFMLALHGFGGPTECPWA